jgi:hypothetical protein
MGFSGRGMRRNRVFIPAYSGTIPQKPRSSARRTQIFDFLSSLFDTKYSQKFTEELLTNDSKRDMLFAVKKYTGGNYFARLTKSKT